MDEHVVAQFRAFSSVFQIDLNLGGEEVLNEIWFGTPCRGNLWMVAQVLTNAWRINDDGDVKLLEMVFRPDAGEHQRLRCAQCARAENNLIAFRNESLASRFHFDGGSLRSVEQDAMHHAVGAQRKVQSVSSFGQVTDVGALPNAAWVVERRWSDAFRVGIVCVGEGRES